MPKIHKNGVLHAALQTRHHLAVADFGFEARPSQKKSMSGLNSHQHVVATSIMRACFVSLNSYCA